MQVLHVVVAGGLQIHEDRHPAADRIELVEVDLDPESAGDRGDVHESVRRAADRLQGDERVVERVAAHDPLRAEVLGRDLDGPSPRALGEALPIRVHGGDGRAPRQHHAERLRHAGHGAGGPHHHAGPGGGGEPVVHVLDLGVVELSRPVHAPEPAAVGARPEPLAAVVPGHHRAGGKDEGGHVRARGGHELGRNGLVAAADEDHRVHRLGPHHLLGVHRHQVAEEHAGGVREGLVKGDGGEGHRQSAREHHPPLHGLDEPRDARVAGVVVAGGVRDADDGAGESVVREAHRLDERLAEEEGEALVTVAGEALAHPPRGRSVRRLLPPAAAECPRKRATSEVCGYSGGGSSSDEIQHQVRMLAHFVHNLVAQCDEEEMRAFAPGEFHRGDEIAVTGHEDDDVDLLLQRQRCLEILEHRMAAELLDEVPD